MDSAIGFITISALLYPILLGLIRKAGKKIGLSKEAINKQSFSIAGALVIWGLYVGLLSRYGIFEDTSVPPKIPFVTFIPLMFLFYFLYRKLKGNQQLNAIPLPWFFGIQSFRIAVELIIVVAITEGILPESAGMDGYNLDVLVGISGLALGLHFVKKPPQSYFWLKVWNLWGIAMIFVVAAIIVTSYYQPQLWNASKTLVHPNFFKYPHLLLPLFLAPTAIFLHFMTLRKLNDLGKKNLN